MTHYCNKLKSAEKDNSITLSQMLVKCVLELCQFLIVQDPWTTALDLERKILSMGLKCKTLRFSCIDHDTDNNFA
jgi:hypothetical protein